MSHVSIARLSVEHYESGLGVGVARPRLSWRFKGSSRDWTQKAYEIELTFSDAAEPEKYKVEAADSVLVPWPSTRSLRSRERVHVRVQSHGSDGTATGWQELYIEAALLEPTDWSAQLLGGEKQAVDAVKRPQYLRRSISLSSVPSGSRARLYITAAGAYKAQINGKPVGDHVLAPGWQSYNHRLHYQTFDVSKLLQSGSNIVSVLLGEGWFASRLNFEGGQRNIYTDHMGVMLQLEVDGQIVASTSPNDKDWEWSYGPVLSSEIYDGEVYDSRLQDDAKFQWSKSTQSLGLPKGKLIPAECPPVRRTQAIKAKNIITTPSAKRILDFGENLVGFLKLKEEPRITEGTEIVLSHAEVLEHRELGRRPLRYAAQRDKITAGGKLEGYEPSFTFHGFRYVQVDGWSDFTTESFEAHFVHSDMERTGWFECSHKMLNQLHDNVIRSMRGNFVSIPSDCPQRDERLGWTGDIAVFAPTAAYLYDTSAVLSGWVQDLACEQLRDHNNVVPFVVPNSIASVVPCMPMAIWGDACIVVPYDMYDAFDDTAFLKRQYESMVAWLDKGITKGENGLWKTPLQLGDWLDPRAPPDLPQEGRTDTFLVADAWLVHVLDRVATVSEKIGKEAEAAKYRKLCESTKEAFLFEYVTPGGRLMSDTQTAIALALHFNIMPKQHIRKCMERLDDLIKKAIFQVSTGFAGTPIILHALSDNGSPSLAYRMIQEKQNPSWLYPVSMGATTIWERWDSMLPDGTINPGNMTSFNHYALGSVASWMHKNIGGISSLAPGWKHTLFSPRPGGTVTSGKAQHLSPYGLISCEWTLSNGKMNVKIEVPPNSTGRVELPGVDAEVGSGEYEYTVDWKSDPAWPPKSIQHTFAQPMPDEFVP